MMTNLEQRYRRILDVMTSLGQEQVLRFWPTLTDIEKRALLDQLEALDAEQLQRQSELIKQYRAETTSRLPQLEPFPVIPLAVTAAEQARDQQAAATGRELLRQGKVAVLVVAGGLGSRLGREEPKGCLEIGPISRRSLFQFHTEKIIRLQSLYGKPILFLIMTSEQNHADTVEYFHRHHYFGMNRDTLFFFSQSSQPAFDQHGKLLLRSRSDLALSPDGHGGLLTALQRHRLVDTLQNAGVELLYYFQVDNVLCRIADPVFLGHHVLQQAEMASKSVAKRNAEEKVGVFCRVNGRPAVVEYSELDDTLRHQRDEQGGLRFKQGSIAIHTFSLTFFRRLFEAKVNLPYHLAFKKMPCLDEQGRPVTPERENAYKLEQFIFDALPYARNTIVVETSREEEFSPVKNATGLDSPETATRALVELFARWLEKAGVTVPRGPDGLSQHRLEISPLYALDEDDLRSKIPCKLEIRGDTFFD
ncbi:UDPGP type 1 family protein [bacterium]|nr:UDPGP type 1 family protein [bacterium]